MNKAPIDTIRKRPRDTSADVDDLLDIDPGSQKRPRGSVSQSADTHSLDSDKSKTLHGYSVSVPSTSAAPSNLHTPSSEPIVKRAPNGQPINVSLPLNIMVPPKAIVITANPSSSVLRIATWNVAGLSASLKKGFGLYFAKEDADIWVITETKMAAPTLEPLITKRYPYRYFSISKKPGYAGVAVFSKFKPVGKVSYTIPAPYHPDPESTRGRIVTAEFEHFWLVGTYFVNAGQGLKNMNEKLTFLSSFQRYIRDLDKMKPVVWAGDVNVAPTAMDLADASNRWNKRPGYTEQETKAWRRLVAGAEDGSGKLIDVWRETHANLEHYSFFDFRQGARLKGLGWRLDMFILSDRIAKKTLACEIRDEIWGASDHCPVVLDLEVEDITTEHEVEASSSA